MRNRSFAHALALALIAGLLALAFPAVAAADDQAVWDAYAHSSSAHALHKASRHYFRAFKALSNHPRTHARLVRARRASLRVARVALRNRKAVKRTTASSKDGNRGRSLLLSGLARFRNSTVFAGRGVRAELHGHMTGARRLYRRAARVQKRATRTLKRGERAMRAAGIKTS